MSGIRMAGRIIRREIMITDTISTIQQFVKNGGRYEKDREPAYGEPFYGKYMEQLIKRDYELGDKIQVEMDNGKVYSGLLMRNAWYYMDYNGVMQTNSLIDDTYYVLRYILCRKMV